MGPMASPDREFGHLGPGRDRKSFSGVSMRAQALLAVGVLALTGSGFSSQRTAAPERIVANTNRVAAGRLERGVLTVRLEARRGIFRPQADDGPGVPVQAFGEAGRPLQIPGPLVRVVEGTVVHAIVRNTLTDSTLVVHGLHTRSGTSDDTLQIGPGSTREVRFVAGAPGTYFYWGSTTGRTVQDDRWVDSGLSGAFIVDEAGVRARPADRVFVIGLWLKPADSLTGEPEREFMVINGKSWPHTERLDLSQGDTVRWRWVNASSSSHPMHLHGFYYQVLSRGTSAADTVYPRGGGRRVVTETMPPGGTMAVRWAPERPGNWVFHCHFAFHVSSELYMSSGGGGHNMSGLVLGMRVRPRWGAVPTGAAGGAAPVPLRLLVRPVHEPADSAHLMSYALAEGSGEPADDSVRIPGPLLVLERGRPVRITVVNRLAEPTAVHWHGIELESYPDGVPGWSGSPGRIFHAIAPGDSFIAEFTPPRRGSFMYHAHANELVQILGGLYGPMVVLDPGEAFDTAANRLVVVGSLFRNDSLHGVVNGEMVPGPIELRSGRTYRFRLLNIGDARTLFSLRRPDSSLVAWRAVAKDGAELPPAQAIPHPEPLLTGPGEIADFEVTAGPPGDLVLDLDSPFAGWRLRVPVHIR